MFCKNCGREVKETDLFCENCGVEIAKEVVPNKETTNVQKQEGNGMAIAGFVCSFFVPILGWIFGGIGMARSFKRKRKGLGFSIAAIVIATVSFLIDLILI